MTHSTDQSLGRLSLAAWYNQEVHRWRTGAAMAWILIFSLPVIWIFVAFENLTFWHPVQSVIDILFMCCHLSSWSCVLMMSVLVSFVACMEAKHYTVVARLPANRLGAVWMLVRPTHLAHVALRTVSGAIIMWLFTLAAGGSYSKLRLSCSQESNEIVSGLCLHEHHLFVIGHGAFIGFLSSVSFFVKYQNQLRFPVIQQSKLFQAKMSIMPLLLQSVSSVFNSIKYYYLLYYLVLGSFLKAWAMTGLGVSNSVADLTSIYGLLDMSLLYYSFVSGTMMHALPSIGSLLYTLYHTKPFEFPITAKTEDTKDKCLQHALTCEKSKLVQYLGYQDLMLLSQHSPYRRRQIFNLSSLGGHPHNWIGIIKPLLESLETFTAEVSHINSQAWSASSNRQLSGDQTNSGQSDKVTDNLIHRKSETTKITSLSDQSEKKPSGMKQTYATTWKEKIWEQLKKRHAISVFITELPDYASKQLFAQTQKYIWGVEALSFLVTHSFREDSYGVVQKNLPEIMAVFLDMQEVVERHSKLGTNVVRRTGKVDAYLMDMELRCALRSALKSALYRICTTFKKHLSSLHLSAEHSRRLRQFTDYKE